MSNTQQKFNKELKGLFDEIEGKTKPSVKETSPTSPRKRSGIKKAASEARKKILLPIIKNWFRSDAALTKYKKEVKEKIQNKETEHQNKKLALRKIVESEGVEYDNGYPLPNRALMVDNYLLQLVAVESSNIEPNALKAKFPDLITKPEENLNLTEFESWLKDTESLDLASKASFLALFKQIRKFASDDIVQELGKNPITLEGGGSVDLEAYEKAKEKGLIPPEIIEATEQKKYEYKTQFQIVNSKDRCNSCGGTKKAPKEGIKGKHICKRCGQDW